MMELLFSVVGMEGLLKREDPEEEGDRKMGHRIRGLERGGGH